MAKKDIRFTLDTINSKYSPVGTVKQLDSVFFYIKITENGVTKDLTGQTIKLFAVKGDKKLVEQTTKINITNETEALVEIELLNAAIQVPGFTYFELEISDNTGIISTSDFILRVDRRVGSDEAIESTNEVATLKEIEVYVAQAKQEIKEFKVLQGEMLETNNSINNQEALRVEAENSRVATESARVESDKLRDEKVTEFGKRIDKMADDYAKALANVTNGNESATNSEIVQARGKEKTLGNRIDKIDFKMIQLENKGTTIEVLERVTKEEIDRQIKDGTIANLTIEDETITNNKLADKSVDFRKTVFFNVVESINKFNKNAVTNEGFILNGSGGYKAQEGCCVSDFIPINEGETIRANTNWNGEFYNKNKEFISQKEFGVEEFIVPRGAYYYRQSIQKAKIDEIIITINIQIDEYIPYSEKITMTNELLEIIEKDVNVKPNNTTFFRCESINLYDYKKATEGYIIGGNGEPTPNETGCISDFISIEQNTMYYFGDKWNGGYYTKNKVFIKQKEFGVMNELSPNGAYYVRVSIPIAKKENYMLVKNYMPEEYIAYEPSLKFTDNENLNEIAEQIKRTGKFDDKYKGVKWVALGDSLTEKNVTAKENYTDFVSKDLKITCINHGIGGTGYMRRYDINKAFYQRVADLPQDADVITIFGSGNDLALMTSLGDITDSTTDTLCGCINKTIDNLLEKFPTTPIGIIAPTPWRGNTPNIKECQMSRYVYKLEQICKRRGIPYLDLYHYSNLHPDNAKCLNLTYYNKSAVDGNGDGVHPNDEGHKIITGPIREFIKSLIK